MFGRKAREELLEARIELERTKADLSHARASHATILEALRRTTQDQLDEARARVHELEVANAVFKERLDLMTQMPQFAAEPRELGVSEEREDLEHALRAGLIGSEQFQAELEASGLLNTQIDFAAEDYPRLGALA